MVHALQRLILLVLIIGSSVGASEPYDDEVEVVAKLTYFAENAAWLHFIDGEALSFHVSVFVALSPQEYCGKEIHVQYPSLLEVPEAARRIGATYRVRIYTKQAKQLIEGQPDQPHTDYIYNTVNATLVESNDSSGDGDCTRKSN